MKWIPIEQVKEHITNRAMFVVIGFDVDVGCRIPYTTDPYCVWLEGGRVCGRWPHTYQPTHFCVLPLKGN